MSEQKMTMAEYLQDSARTAPEFSEDNPLNIDDVTFQNLKQLVEVFLNKGEELDQIKKHIFYKKPYPNGNPEVYNEQYYQGNDFEANLIHGIVGKMTEVVECFEVLNDVLDHKEIDRVNLEEEVGDDFWYSAMVLRAINSTFEDAGRVNINKLRKRFPDKFDADKAINRDTVVEREQMESDINSNEDK